jgi:tetratricopeptide (TPR) repeat protein
MDYYDRMRFKTRFLPALMLTCSLSLHAQSPTTSEPASKSSALDSQLFYQILLGEFSARAEEPGTAFSLLLDSARKTNDPALYKRAVQIALQARSGDSALAAAKAWSQALPASKEANLYVLQILLNLNRVAETIEPLKRELALTTKKNLRETLWAIPGSFDRISDKHLAASTVQKALTPLLTDAEVGATAWAVVGRLWQSAGDTPAALSAATKGIQRDPKSEHVALLALSMMSPELAQAEALVKKHIASSPRAEFLMAYVKSLLTAKRDADAQMALTQITTQHPDYPDAWLVQGALAMQNAKFAEAETLLKHYIALAQAASTPEDHPELRRGLTQAFMSLAHMAEQQKDLKQADAWLARVSHPDDIMRAQIKRAVLMANQGQIEAGIALIQSQTELSATDTRLKLTAEVQLLRDHKLFSRARTVLESAIASHPDDMDWLYDLAMVTEKLGDLTTMENLLRRLITNKPDDPQAYNALGYSLADNNLRLPEARELIIKALTLSPGDPFITDSLAWVEFKMGNKAEALRLLETAFKSKPDAEISAHLGEVLWSLNQTQEAIKIWKQGLGLNPNNETLIETLKRFSVSL